MGRRHQSERHLDGLRKFHNLPLGEWLQLQDCTLGTLYRCTLEAVIGLQTEDMSSGLALAAEL
jgi:hypothetical protein